MMTTPVEVLEGLLDELQTQRDRLILEREALLIARKAGCAAASIVVGTFLGQKICELDVGQLETRADSLLSMIGAIEVHVGRFPAPSELTPERLERVLDGTALIAAAVDDSGALSDLLADLEAIVVETVTDLRDLGRDLGDGLLSTGTGIVIGAVAVAGLVVVSALRS